MKRYMATQRIGFSGYARGSRLFSPLEDSAKMTDCVPESERGLTPTNSCLPECSMRRILSFVPPPTSMEETTLSTDAMILDNTFNQAATPPGVAPRANSGAIILPAGFGLLGARARRRSLAARRFGLSSVTLLATALAVSGRAYADSLPVPVESVAACSASDACQSSAGSGQLVGGRAPCRQEVHRLAK
jgi:hypothetical protein